MNKTNEIEKTSVYSERKRNLSFLIFIISPAAIFASVILYYPIINTIIMSFQKIYFGKNEYEWVGLKNFINVIKSGTFLETFSWTFIFATISVTLLLIIGMYFALLLNRKFIGKNVFRGLLLLPWTIPTFVNAFLWLWLLNVQFGLINYILKSLNIINEYIHWTGGKYIAKVSVLIAYVWRVFPFNMIVYLAAFQTINPEYYEAAEIDGANKFKQFIHITFPHIRNIVVFIALLNFAWAFQEFTTIWLLTQGGPAGATHTLNTQVYSLAFQQAYNFGEASAIGVLWLVFMIIFSIIYLRFLFFRDRDSMI